MGDSIFTSPMSTTTVYTFDRMLPTYVYCFLMDPIGGIAPLIELSDEFSSSIRKRSRGIGRMHRLRRVHNLSSMYKHSLLPLILRIRFCAGLSLAIACAQ